MNKSKNKKQAVETGLDAALDKCVRAVNRANISESDLVVKFLGRCLYQGLLCTGQSKNPRTK